jgi:hypothetical protein
MQRNHPIAKIYKQLSMRRKYVGLTLVGQNLLSLPANPQRAPWATQATVSAARLPSLTPASQSLVQVFACIRMRSCNCPRTTLLMSSTSDREGLVAASSSLAQPTCVRYALDTQSAKSYSTHYVWQICVFQELVRRSRC